jgi:hypothetical protein
MQKRKVKEGGIHHGISKSEVKMLGFEKKGMRHCEIFSMRTRESEKFNLNW